MSDIRDQLRAFTLSGVPGKCYLTPQVAKLLGYSDLGSLSGQIIGGWKEAFKNGTHFYWMSSKFSAGWARWLGTSAGSRSMMMLTESGLRLAVMRCKLPAAKQYQQALAEEGAVGALEKDAAQTTPPPPAAPPAALAPVGDPLMAQLQALMTIRQEQIALSQKTDDLSRRLALVESRPTLMLQAASDKPPEKTDRAKLNQWIRGWVFATHGKDEQSEAHKGAFDRLYREFVYTHNVDLKACARNRGKAPLDVAEEDGHMDKLYTLACALFPLASEV